MEAETETKQSLWREPSAFLPIAMSLMVVAMFVAHFIFLGAPQPEPDEGTEAHLFQLLMGAQIPIILYFAVRRLPEKPKAALKVLAVQALAALAACAPVYLYHL